MSSGEAVAAIDCGTNSTRLLIAGQGDEVVRREMRITRLGQGVDATGLLAPEAIERTLEVLRSYRSMMDEASVGRARAVATSAVRDAGNGDEFLQAAGQVLGTDAELLSGLDEARLSYRGATAGLPPGAAETVVVDIGGGSTELVVARDGDLQACSLDLGCVRLSERVLRHDPPTEEELVLLVEQIDTALGSARTTVPALSSLRPGSRLIGLAGTVSTIAGLELGLEHYDRAQVHHSALTLDAVARWCRALAAEPAAARAERAGMVEGRQDVIVGGAFILREVMRDLGFSECLVSESDILDGMVASLRD